MTVYEGQQRAHEFKALPVLKNTRKDRVQLLVSPAPGLQHVGLVQARDSQAFHRACELFAYFK